MKIRERKSITPETLESLAKALVDYRLGGCPSGGAVAVQDAVRKAARAHGRAFSDLWPEVHRRAYEIIDAAS